jgi:hypothetical protein
VGDTGEDRALLAECLTIILSAADQALPFCNEDDPVRPLLFDIRRAAQRLAGIQA